MAPLSVAVTSFSGDDEASCLHVTAHRSFGERYPENTVCAAWEASDHADAVEVDVRRCGSGELVASHWDHVGFVTDGEGDIDELSAAELAALDVGDSSYGIPPVTDVLDAIPPEVGVVLDLKERGVAADVVNLARRVPNDTVVASFHPDPLWRTRMFDESIPVAYNFDLRPDSNFETAAALDCEYAFPHWTLCLATDVVERAHDAGMAVHAWPVGSRMLARALSRGGVDGVVATEPL
ncbi:MULTISPECIES: glycerophosphodiester phosphodiesterase [Halorussus]|uniref:glycerophosphodiester phosphodiesterase n=1 Tax=Halorussus TaxID=1070314 RepID=UPI00209DBD17|nr:glycerophosphodiester phosphodiesterase [Halorussus vallis]USZ76344.1 glycerophosphodiester phosphodiesterase [Halorussus vallis]